jgi:guanylate kinase
MAGHLVIISSPSGGGKDAVINELIKIFPQTAKLMTTTTRAPRPGEQNGVSYNFVTREEFQKMIDEKKLVEHNLYADNYYGTEKSQLENDLKKYDIVFSNIEINGKKNFDRAGWSNLSIFLLPESDEILRERIERRGGLTPDKIAERLKTAVNEVAESAIYDYKIVNYQGKLAETVKKIAKILSDRFGLDINE